MSIIAKKELSTFTPAPEGLHQAVCCDVVDLGLKNTPWGDKHKIRIVWVTTRGGRPPRTSSNFYSNGEPGLALPQFSRQRFSDFQGRWVR